MAEDMQTQTFEQDEVEVVEYEPRTFKFMTNVLLPSSETTTYVEQLENITGDPRISFRRIIIGMGVSAAVLIVTVRYLTKNPERVPYVIIPAILFIVCSLILILTYLLPEKDYSSTFEVSFNAIMSNIAERLRKKSGFKLGFPAINIAKNGVFKLSPEQFCRLYKVVGQLNNTTLAQYVDQLASVRDSYLVERESTVEEMFITKIKTLSYEDNLNYFKDTYEGSDDKWSKDYLSLQYNFVNSQMAYQEIGFIQYLMISDITKDRLDQACQVMQNAAAEGLYEEIQLITDPQEIKEVVGSPTLIELLSNAQEEQLGKDKKSSRKK